MPRVLSAILCLLLCAPALALTGNAPPATGWAARAIVMIVDPRGDLCTGTALTRDLVLTAAHCVARASSTIRSRPSRPAQPISVRAIAPHPRFDFASYAASRATADVALIKLAAPLPDLVVPATARAGAPRRRRRAADHRRLRRHRRRHRSRPRPCRAWRRSPSPASPARCKSVCTIWRRATARIGLGACTGDSGAPAFEPASEAVIGVVSWSTAPGDEEGCGGLTGVTPLLLYRDWIVETARKFNSPVGP